MDNPPGYVWFATLIGPAAFLAMVGLALHGGALRAGLPRQKATLVAVGSVVVLGGWLGISAAIADDGGYDTASGLPSLPIAMLGATGMFLALSRTPVVARALAAPGMMSRLILPQSVRVTGVAPLIYLALGHLPALFAVPAALGDIATGIAAPFAAHHLHREAGRRRALWFNAFGVTDLIVSLALGGLTGYQLIKVTPAADLSHLPIVLVPTAVVPMLLTLHIVSIRALMTAARTRGSSDPDLPSTRHESGLEGDDRQVDAVPGLELGE